MITNKETRTLKESLPLLLKRRLFTNFNMFVFKINTIMQHYHLKKKLQEVRSTVVVVLS